MENTEVLHEMAREEDDACQESEIQAFIDNDPRSPSRTRRVELRSLFTGPHDEADCIVQINAKDGGVDAQDWSEMLLRMYQRWAERRGFHVRASTTYSEGTEAGIMSADDRPGARPATPTG